MKTGIVAFLLQIISGGLLGLFGPLPEAGLAIPMIPLVAMVLLMMCLWLYAWRRMVASLETPEEVGDPPWEKLKNITPLGGWLTGPWSWGICVPADGFRASNEELGLLRKHVLQFWLGVMLTFFGAGISVAICMMCRIWST